MLKCCILLFFSPALDSLSVQREGPEPVTALPQFRICICSNIPTKRSQPCPIPRYFWSFPTNRAERSFPTKCQQTVWADNSLLSVYILWFVLFLFLVKCHTCQKSERHFSIVTRFCDGSCETFKTYRYFHKYPVSAQTLPPWARKAKEWISVFSFPARYQNGSWNLDIFLLSQKKTRTN